MVQFSELEENKSWSYPYETTYYYKVNESELLIMEDKEAGLNGRLTGKWLVNFITPYGGDFMRDGRGSGRAPEFDSAEEAYRALVDNCQSILEGLCTLDKVFVYFSDEEHDANMDIVFAFGD